jgi:hypothetical protein
MGVRGRCRTLRDAPIPLSRDLASRRPLRAGPWRALGRPRALPRRGRQLRTRPQLTSGRSRQSPRDPGPVVSSGRLANGASRGLGGAAPKRTSHGTSSPPCRMTACRRPSRDRRPVTAWKTATSARRRRISGTRSAVCSSDGASKPIRASRASHPWQNGQWMTEVPHSPSMPGSSGRRSRRPWRGRQVVAAGEGAVMRACEPGRGVTRAG